MRTAVKVLLGLAVVVCSAVVAAQAADEKEKTLKGEMVCGKCTLKICEKCTNVLVVKEAGKDVNYFIDDAGNGEVYHRAICPANKKQKAEVTGIVSVKDGKKWIKPSKDGVKIIE